MNDRQVQIQLSRSHEELRPRPRGVGAVCGVIAARVLKRSHARGYAMRALSKGSPRLLPACREWPACSLEAPAFQPAKGRNEAFFGGSRATKSHARPPTCCAAAEHLTSTRRRLNDHLPSGMCRVPDCSPISRSTLPAILRLRIATGHWLRALSASRMPGPFSQFGAQTVGNCAAGREKVQSWTHQKS